MRLYRGGLAMAFVDYDGTHFFYEESGAGEPPLLLVHGIGNHTHFAPQIECFADSHRVIAPDLVGFGQSDAPQREYGIAAFAHDIGWLCEELELQDPVIVGHSM